MVALLKKTPPAATVKPRVAVRGAAPAAATTGFKYRPRTAEEVRERAQKSIGGRDSYFNSDVQFFTSRTGENNVRILPPPPEKAEEWRHYGVSVALHYGIGSDKSAYLCRNKMKGEPCILCEERDRATSAGEEDLADDLRPQYRVAVFVIDRAQESKGPLLWNMPASLDKDIIKLCIDPSTGETLNVDDPDNGYDLSFTREGEGIKTKYKGIQFSRKDSPLADEQEAADKWLGFVVAHPIDEALIFHDNDYITKVYEGQAPPAKEEAEAPKGAKVPARGAAQAAAPAAKAKIPVRGAAKPAAEPEPEPAADELPSWEDLAELDEDGLGAIIEGTGISDQVPSEGFDSIEAIRDWVAATLGIEAPAPEPEPEAAAAPAGAPDWKARLAALKNKKK